MTPPEACHRCGAAIVLMPMGLHFKWVLASHPKRRDWHCQPTAEFPVRSHAPEGAGSPVTKGQNLGY